MTTKAESGLIRFEEGGRGHKARSTEAEKGKEMDFSSELPEGTSPVITLILAPYDSFWTSDFQKCRRIHLYCF